ncbi:MAG: alpha-mannosidase, partial [Clostridia bacterium]|nr:alpha-mannosidase [Clostridia bacterium]
MKKVYLICNAHIDPMWLWEWEEGAAAAVSTFRSAAYLCENYDTLIFNHNEALLYKWIEQYEPELFERIKILVKKGRWNIIGGWYLQPDCLMPSGEGFVRQILEGNNYFKEKFDIDFKTAINLDSFGHTRGLVQIMAKCGYENYLVCRPLNKDFPLKSNNFYWEGFDGSKIFTRRHYELYNSPLGQAAEKIEDRINSIEEGENLMILWGVGNHGGGPSEKDINDIAALSQKMLSKDIHIKHSTPDEYFDAVKADNSNIIKTSLKPCNTGCLSSMALIKQKYRELENLLFATEKIASAASAYGLVKYPKNEIREAIEDLLLIQFHDILPGTAIKPVEEAGLRIAHHGIEILTRIRARCFFALAKSQEVVTEGYPVLVYNYHPYTADSVIECEFQLADQNW